MSYTGSNMNFAGANAGAPPGAAKRKADDADFALPAPKRDTALQASSAVNVNSGGGGYGAWADEARSPPSKPNAGADQPPAPMCQCGVLAQGMTSKVGPCGGAAHAAARAGGRPCERGHWLHVIKLPLATCSRP